MTRTKMLTSLAVAVLGGLVTIAPAASAAPAPAWQISLNSQPTNLSPGIGAVLNGYPEYEVFAENVGAATTSGPITVTVQLPSGILPAAAKAPSARDGTHIESEGGVSCSVSAQTVVCVDSNPVDPGDYVDMVVPVDVANLTDPTGLSAVATISGGGASATTTTATTVSNALPPHGLLAGREGFNASVTGEDGTPATQAGSHPQQLNVNLGLPTQLPDVPQASPQPDGTLHDVRVDLPTGLVIDPSATPKCTAAEFQSFSCPDSTEVGSAGIPVAAGEGVSAATSSAIVNLEPPPGHAAAFGFYVFYVPVTILGGVRPGEYPGGYRITSLTAAAPSILTIFQARLQFWGSPSDESHDKVRGLCKNAGEPTRTCPVSRTDKPLITLPTSCTESIQAEAHVDTWEDVGSFFDRAANLTDSNGNATEVSGCNQLQFEPTLKARPTTNVADSPSGLEAEVSIPPNDHLGTLSTAHLRRAAVTLPEGVAVNPASANGLQGCSQSQVGIDPATGIPNDEPVTCPDASRIGTVAIDTPLLEDPLPGSVYIADPYDNPFDSLLAIYVVAHDPERGVLIKLAGHVEADPVTGQLKTTFDDNPQLPFEHFKLRFFGGATAALRTPAVCGKYTTASQMTPWSAPEAADAHPSDSFEVTTAPNGGACPTSPGAAPNSPSFEAGTVTPQAGAYSPFVLKLSRQDGSQQLTGFDAVLPPGLTGKLAGVAECSEVQIAQAKSREHPNEGALEKSAPSCPASSEVGTVEVGAGAGPAPLYVQGHAYLAGPYKGAPLSLVVITPAVAGPYDLGTVVVRAALYVDPLTAQIHAVSDPFPTILDGIPLDLRSVAVRMDRSRFTLNPTSCDRFQIGGSATSALGGTAPLASPFQVGGCSALDFEPTLKLALKGGTRRAKHPALKSVLTFPAGRDSANVAKAIVTLPHSEIIDQAHVGNPCTRPQFAEEKCPQISILGTAKAWTPLLDEPLEGNVYFRSNGGVRELPDIVADLRGKIHVELIGAVDTATPKRNARLRTTFFSVPDAPVSRFELQLKGGKEGLLVNSDNICRVPQKAVVELDGHNGAVYDTQPKVTNQCAKRKSKGRGKPRR